MLRQRNNTVHITVSKDMSWLTFKGVPLFSHLLEPHFCPLWRRQKCANVKNLQEKLKVGKHAENIEWCNTSSASYHT